ncbi:MAG: IS1595 family transposase [Rhodospirillaceae bacterium]|nr:IS1595 family transposase [Rhodospirillaceae bacterium]MDE0619090.1 IS1595 family transposase [Rhodospirillaceae bacterium]
MPAFGLRIGQRAERREARHHPFRCRKCRKRFSVKTGTVMEASNIGYQNWAVAIYLFMTSLKSVSSMKLARELGITQKAAWFLAHRLRDAYRADTGLFGGPVEVDEAYMGGRESNKHADKKLQAGRGTVGKSIVAGVRDRVTGKVSAEVVPYNDRRTLQSFVEQRAVIGAKVYTDEAAAYREMPYHRHGAVRHASGEYVRGEAHTQGIEAFWAMLKRAHKSTFHKISPKHLQRYVDEFAGRHNVRELDTADQMGDMVAGMVGRRLKYDELTADNELANGARG